MIILLIYYIIILKTILSFIDKYLLIYILSSRTINPISFSYVVHYFVSLEMSIFVPYTSSFNFLLHWKFTSFCEFVVFVFCRVELSFSNKRVQSLTIWISHYFKRYVYLILYDPDLQFKGAMYSSDMNIRIVLLLCRFLFFSNTILANLTKRFGTLA